METVWIAVFLLLTLSILCLAYTLREWFPGVRLHEEKITGRQEPDEHKSMSFATLMAEERVMNRLAEAVAARIERRRPKVERAFPDDGETEISEELHRLYLRQIAEAQAYLNENRHADLSHTQCLLRRMLPAPYHEAIDRLREHQDAQAIYNIYGGVHQHAPNATHAEQRKDT